MKNALAHFKEREKRTIEREYKNIFNVHFQLLLPLVNYITIFEKKLLSWHAFTGIK